MSRSYTIYVLDGSLTYQCDYTVSVDGLKLEDVSLDGTPVTERTRETEALFARLYNDCLDDASLRLARKPGFRWLHSAALAAQARSA